MIVIDKEHSKTKEDIYIFSSTELEFELEVDYKEYNYSKALKPYKVKANKYYAVDSTLIPLSWYSWSNKSCFKTPNEAIDEFIIDKQMKNKLLWKTI